MAVDYSGRITFETKNMRKNISSGAEWEPVVGYSRAVRTGNLIEVSGTTATWHNGHSLKDDLYGQAFHSLKKIEDALIKAGATLKDVVRTRMYVTDISRWQEAARAHHAFFKEVMPATSMVEVTKLIHPDMLIEIEATAFVISE
jgi:enamine deaminase RidA (YjgF/YER057c/UK114 family)